MLLMSTGDVGCMQTIVSRSVVRNCLGASRWSVEGSLEVGSAVVSTSLVLEPCWRDGEGTSWGEGFSWGKECCLIACGVKAALLHWRNDHLNPGEKLHSI